MIKLFILMVFILTGACPLKADERTVNDQQFIAELNTVKSPFDDGLPKPVPVVKPQPVEQIEKTPPPVEIPKPKPVSRPVVTIPSLHLQGVIVGNQMHQAIINDQVVPLHGTIEGARVIAVTKQGVEMSYSGKKFFLKVD